MARIKQEVDTESSKSIHTSQQPEAKSETATGIKRPAPSESNSSSRDSSPPPPKVAHVEGPPTFQCPMCSYCADKPASLNRHMRIHNRPPDPPVDVKPAAAARVGSAPGVTAAPNSATYCKDCSIQFSNMSTYQCHKMHYCSQRNAGRTSADSKVESPQFGIATVPTLGMPSSLSAASLQLPALGQNGLLFPPGSAMAGESASLPSGAAMMPGGQAAVILTAPVMTPSGVTNMAIPLSTVLQSIQAAAAATVNIPASSASATSPHKSSSPKVSDSSPRSVPEEAHQNKSPKRSYSSDTENNVKELPLDLSTKKSDSEDSSSSDKRIKREEEKSPVSAAPSMSSSPVTGRSSSAEGADPPYGSTLSSKTPSTTPSSMAGIPPHLLNPSLLQTLLPMHSMTGLPVTPPAHPFGGIPPGSSKCTDCNIIFYKHENFLIHKQHYCSGTKLRPSPSVPLMSPKPAELDVMKPEPSATVTSPPEPKTSQSPSRITSPSKDSESASSSQPHHLSPASVKLPVRNAGVPAPGMEDVYYKFLCIPCKIKFSSATNLKAHKEYYCPHGKNSEHTIIAQTPSGEIVSRSRSEQQSPHSNGSSPSPGQYCCTQCRATFTSSRLLKLHLCSAEVAQTSLLKCSHCDYVTHTDKRLAEHMKVHNPTSAYRCTLCGYRGNTVRGMRMHGKTHTDNGEDFTDSHMIEFQEPPLVPIQTNSDYKVAQGPLSIEAELLRLKNEPYKRRRSRKAYEKVDILVPLDDPHSCPLCGECFPEPRSLIMHMRIHDIANQYIQELSRCPQCDFVAKSFEELRAHMEISHGLIPREEKENHPQSTSPDRRSPPERKSFERVSSVEKKNVVSIKEEPVDSDYDNRDDSNRSVLDKDRRNNSVPMDSSPGEDTEENVDNDDSDKLRDRPVNSADKEANGDDIDVEKCSDPTEVVRVIKTDPELDRDEDSCNDPPLPITFATPPSTSQPPLSNSPASPQQRPARSPPTSTGHDRNSPTTTTSPPVPAVSVKVEPEYLPHNQAPLFPRFFVAPARSPEGMGTSSQDRNGIEERPADVSSKPYCKYCDISFMYRSTFIAHKKYYCTERIGAPPSATA